MTVTISDWLIIAATLLSPLIAVQAQQWIERARHRKAAQHSIFYALMSTRATRLAPEHVQALNRIDLEFGKRGWRQTQQAKVVVNKWRVYADHLHNLADNPTRPQLDAWVQRGDDLFIELLAALAKELGYSFDDVQLRRGIYHPRGHTDAEIRQDVIQRAFADILIGKRSFPMEVTGFPASQEALDLQKEAHQAVVKALKDGALKVEQK
jgi:hypothetical protein